jgi:hypothetical protein
MNGLQQDVTPCSCFTNTNRRLLSDSIAVKNGKTDHQDKVNNAFVRRGSVRLDVGSLSVARPNRSLTVSGFLRFVVYLSSVDTVKVKRPNTKQTCSMWLDFRYFRHSVNF